MWDSIHRLRSSLKGSAPEEDSTTAAVHSSPPTAVPGSEKPKPKWQRLTDRHLGIATLPPDEALPLIRLAFYEELAEPFEERALKRDALFHALISDFTRLDTRYADLRPSLPATPLEIQFYQKDDDHDPNRTP